MKAKLNLDQGVIELDGTAEEIAGYVKAVVPDPSVRFMATTPVCTCPKWEPGQSTVFWAGPCPVHNPTYAPAFPQVTAAAGRPPVTFTAAPATMTHAHPTFESAELGRVPVGAAFRAPVGPGG